MLSSDQRYRCSLLTVLVLAANDKTALHFGASSTFSAKRLRVTGEWDKLIVSHLRE